MGQTFSALDHLGVPHCRTLHRAIRKCNDVGSTPRAREGNLPRITSGTRAARDLHDEVERGSLNPHVAIADAPAPLRAKLNSGYRDAEHHA